MATNLPRPLPDLMNWAAAHASQWQDNQAQIGLSLQQVQSFKALGEAMNQANSAAEVARMNSKDATLALNAAVASFRVTAGAFVNVIKAFAQSTGNENVYTLAGISPDDAPSELPAPNTPESFTAGVNTDGSLTIRWRVSQPAGVTGVVYDVFRRYNTATGNFVWVGSGDRNKTFTDTTLPVGVDNVQYYVRPKRGEAFGPQSNVFALQFGSVGGGGGGANLTIVSQDELGNDGAMKVAA